MREPVVRAVKIYARGVAETEWRALSAGEATDKTDKLFTAVISRVTDVKPEDETERILYPRLLDIANQASSHRDERLFPQRRENAADPSGICHAYRVYDSFLLFFYPFRNLALGLVAVAITTMLLFFANFVLTDLDNPFEGTWNVGSEPFAELVTRFR